MAEVLATMVVGPLLSMVKDKASSYLLDQYKVMEGMEEQHELLKRKLPAVLDVIADAEEQAAKHREGAKAWLEAVRKVAYKANDVLDEFKYEALRRKAKAEGHYKELGMDVIKLFPSHNRFVFRCRMANKLRRILQQLDVLITEMNTFRFRFKQQPSMSSLKWRQTDPNISKSSLDIASKSRESETKEIVDTLLRQGSNVGLTVLPIFGMGGMGKTTLAQLVYNDSVAIHKKHFQLRLWVCVSENFDVDFLVERILQAAKENECKAEGNSASDKLKSALSGKRYLLVLDDVWNREANKWEKLKSYLDHGGNGSSVLITTRDENVANIMGTIKAHKIMGLHKSFIEKIIEATAFSSQAGKPVALRNKVGDVAERCSGSPLAATALGSVLRTKNTVQEWDDLLSRNTICDEENGILPILKLSFNCLLPHMRQCFAFCAMFPKNYEIDVEMLIRLWMANSFIPEQGVCPEVTGKKIFDELVQRSFFQEVKQAYKGYSTTTCKIHDLMHDVAQDSMGKECATIDTELSQREDFPFSARHLFLSVGIPETALNAYLEKESPAIQTLLSTEEAVSHLSEYCSVRALKILGGSFIELKYLHHLRYLDLSESDIEALPKDITILYHLQTLNLSFCKKLKRLPKAMKYMIALRHLYTHGCGSLKSIPSKLGNLTSLQTLTCFVAGTGSGCSDVGELKKLLDLGGQLELRQLENVKGADARAASLGKKTKLKDLTLRWTDNSSGEEAHNEVMEGLEPHDGLEAMKIYSCGCSVFPTWILKLHGMVKLELRDCKTLKKLPALWELRALEFLRLSQLENLHCLFSGRTLSKFQTLKAMSLSGMPSFESWWDEDVVLQGVEPLFPKVEILRIDYCGKLTALPIAGAIGEESPGCRSAFPLLRVMSLNGLEMLHRWEEEAVQGALGNEPEEVMFPQLEELKICDCPKLTTFPEAPKLSKLVVRGCRDETSLLAAASRYITSLSSLDLGCDTAGTRVLQASSNKQNWIELLQAREKEGFPLSHLELRRCNDLFFSDGWSALALWTCFRQLVTLTIFSCDALVDWPEKMFQSLVSLRTLNIFGCSNLTGHTEDRALSEQQSVPIERSGCGLLLLPCLEFLGIHFCESLVELNLAAPSLKTLHISRCHRLMGSMVFIIGQQQQEQEGGEGVVWPADTSSPRAAGSSSSPSNHHRLFVPCLEVLSIRRCGGLSEVANLPSSIKEVKIDSCDNLGCVSSSQELPSSLKFLIISNCRSLVEFPGINLLAPSPQHRLEHLEYKGSTVTRFMRKLLPSTRLRSSEALCFKSRSTEED